MLTKKLKMETMRIVIIVSLFLFLPIAKSSEGVSISPPPPPPPTIISNPVKHTVQQLEADLNGDGKNEVILLVRKIDQEIDKETKLGGERIEIYLKGGDKTPVFVSQWFDYVKRNEVMKATGEIVTVEREKLLLCVAYIYTEEGGGSGGETYKQTYYLFGWNGVCYENIFKEIIHEQHLIYARSDTEGWEPGSYNETIRELKFNGKEIIINIKKYEIPVLQKTPDSKGIEVPTKPEEKFLKKQEVSKFSWDESKHKHEYMLEK